MTMNIRERLAAVPRFEKIDVPGLGEVNAKILTMADIIGLSGSNEPASETAILTFHDDEHKPLFANAEELKALPHPLFTAIMNICKTRLGVGGAQGVEDATGK